MLAYDGLQAGPPAPPPPPDRSAGPAARGRKVCFTWRIENFLAFKEIMETRKIFSRCGRIYRFYCLMMQCAARGNIATFVASC